MEYKTLTDEELIRRLRGGDKGIANYLMEKYKSLVRKKAKAMYLLGGENDDLIQEGMIGLFQALQDFDPDCGKSFAGFADLCVSRQLISAVRAAGRKKHSPLNSYISIYSTGEEGEEEQKPLAETIEAGLQSNPEELFMGRETARVFEEELISRLSNMENRVYYLHMLGTDYLTIAKLMGKSPKAVDNALQRIKTKAKELLDENGN